ncbi:hypothetical protein LO771_21160 [Streptacidiphilus sp. ASG 303]|uniref:hypothetical protein n=1 Tax=Streptacidiphilus sp. ASG 303 TaxID=2896847 RepID=UPI001E3298F6|nr:hypothetical protein [Streptacidiphilus sp. ASG 303]MCD0484832.1 hypothetical protein [Streptacidiphilus sp. ASG 303]
MYGDLLDQLDLAAERAGEFAAARAAETATGGLLRWGTTSTADDAFWRCGSVDPEGWTTVVSRRQHAWGADPWLEFDCGMGEFLLGLFRRDIACPFGQDNFPGDHPQFMSWREEDDDFDGAWGETGSWPCGQL